MKQKTIVISAVNLTEGGPLSILKDAVSNFVVHFIYGYKLVLLVNNKNLLDDNLPDSRIKILEYTYPKKSWLLRAWFEYIHCWFISKKINPDVWISLNDITPNVITKTKIVYCQNPAPFYELGKKQYMNEKKLFFFHFFYAAFYRINIRSNKYVIVQQQWLRHEFEKRFKINNVLVAHPDVVAIHKMNECKPPQKFAFFYPALPRAFKNFEVLIKAAEYLYKVNKNFEVIMTFDGSENNYAAGLAEENRARPYLKFIGVQSRRNIWQLYNACSCLVFPSLMETWGLPVSEIKLYNKPILIANLKYAHETVGSYDKACFFDAGDPAALAALMEKAVKGILQYHTADYLRPQQPFVQSWKELYDLILSDKTPEDAGKKYQMKTLQDL